MLCEDWHAFTTVAGGWDALLERNNGPSTRSSVHFLTKISWGLLAKAKVLRCTFGKKIIVLVQIDLLNEWISSFFHHYPCKFILLVFDQALKWMLLKFSHPRLCRIQNWVTLWGWSYWAILVRSSELVKISPLSSRFLTSPIWHSIFFMIAFFIISCAWVVFEYVTLCCCSLHSQLY